jgi:polysaccharide export outer membrane protein
MLQSRFLYFLIILILITGTSCTRQKKMLYMQNLQMSDTAAVVYNEHMQYKIQPGDILYIRVITINENMNKLFNLETSTNYNYGYNEANMFLQGYLVNDTGYVTLPVVGEVSVKNMAIQDAQLTIKKHIDEYIKDATVIVKLTSFKITILGEVHRPGIYMVYDNGINLFEALGKAGDLTDYGNRHNVLIVRQTREGTKSFRVSLLDKEILFSEFFYIHPNDVIYVEPVKTKAWKMNAPNISIILSSLTTMIVVLNFILRF